MILYVDLNDLVRNDSGEMEVPVTPIAYTNRNFQRDAKEGKIIPIYAEEHRGTGRLYICEHGCWKVAVIEMEIIPQEEYNSLDKMFSCYLDS